MMAQDRARLARAISAVEAGTDGDRALLKAGLAKLAAVRIVGVTGPPGSGKSTLADALAAAWAERGREVAVLAVDPSSPFSGGAVLGDRLRMRRAEGHERVFIRSLAARGHAGGLAAAVPDACALLAAHGVERILVETVGVGQNDVEIKDHADCVLVVAVPGLGDGLQAAKAGLMEIGDLFVVNKADLPGADRVQHDIEAMLGLAYRNMTVGNGAAGTGQPGTPGERMLRERHGANGGSEAWIPPVLPLSATSAAGLPALDAAIERFFLWAAATGHFRSRRLAMQRAQLRHRVRRLMEARLAATRLGETDAVTHWAARIDAAELLPDEAARCLLSAADAATKLEEH